MMKRTISLAMAVLLLVSGCSSNSTDAANDVENPIITAPSATIASTLISSTKPEHESEYTDVMEETPYIPEGKVEFDDLNDPDLMQYIQDNIYADLENEFENDDYQIDNISTSFVSKEYLDELEFNSRKNIYFGYSLKEIENQFEGERFMFTLGSNGQTQVVKFEGYDNTFDQVVKNVAVGSGVILVCVTVSVVTAGAGAPVASMIFAASAKTGTTVALSSGVLAGASAGIITALETKDPEQALKTMALNASEGFKWGAIAGAATGGLSAAASAYLSNVPTPRESELRALKEYGGTEQVSYLDGKEVPFGTPNATRPDVISDALGHKEAIEVKNYDLTNPNSVERLYEVLHHQIGQRAINLPDDFTQRVVLDIKGRGYSNELVEQIIKGIQISCQDVYPNLPVSIMV